MSSYPSIAELLVPITYTIRETLRVIDQNAQGIAFVVNGQNKGIWAMDIESGEIVQIQTPLLDDCVTQATEEKKSTPSSSPTEEDFKNYAINTGGYDLKKSFVKQSDTKYWGEDEDGSKSTIEWDGNKFIVSSGHN